MANPNTQLERICYLIETTTGTKDIDDAGDTTYWFGAPVDEGGDYTQPSPTRTKDVAHSYNSREAVSSTTKYNASSISAETKAIIPYLCTPWYLLLGDATDAATDTIQVKDTGLKKAVDLHSEYKGGTTEDIRDLVGAYLTGLKWHMEVGKVLVCDHFKWEGWSIQDEDSTEASVALTNEPTIDQDKLPFVGINEIKWDTGDADETLTRVYRVDFDSNHGIVSTPATGTAPNISRVVYPTKFGDRATTGHKFYMSAILDTHTQYDDLRNGIEVNVTFKSKKADGSDYVKFLYGGVHILDITKAIPRGGGYSERIISCEANSLSLEFDDGVSVFATMYP